jgi:dTDP-4-dehydrorhamnose 3,5-epimerase
MPFEFEPMELDDVILVKPEVFEDERGFLLETYDKEAFEDVGISTEFVLEFYSKSKRNVLRGFHQQTSPYQQAKIVRCISGEIFDVAVDVRPESDTYGEHVTYRLSEDNKHALYLPRGFLHGYVTLSESALVYYKVDNEYSPENEHGVIWNDPEIDVDWPVEDPEVSEKDREWPQLQESIYAPGNTNSI